MVLSLETVTFLPKSEILSFSMAPIINKFALNNEKLLCNRNKAEKSLNLNLIFPVDVNGSYSVSGSLGHKSSEIKRFNWQF